MINEHGLSEIERINYMEHFKKAKELALIYPPDHPLRIELAEVMNNILKST